MSCIIKNLFYDTAKYISEVMADEAKHFRSGVHRLKGSVSVQQDRSMIRLRSRERDGVDGAGPICLAKLKSLCPAVDVLRLI